MRNQMRTHTAVVQFDDMKSWAFRWKREVSNADKIPVRNAVPMGIQCVKRAPQQTGRYRSIGCFASSESARHNRSISHSRKRDFDQRTARICQDDQLQRKYTP
jgi:hypothetical protein